jgi:hypothetical protein
LVAVLAAGVLATGISLAAPAALASPLGPAESVHSAGPASAGPGSFGIRLVDVPVSEAADSRAWRYIIDYLHPGTVIHRRVAVQNRTSSVAHVSVYADAATITGGEFIGDAGQARNELTTWTSVSRPVLTLAPRASAMVVVTIRVPRDAVAGERYAVIWAQETSRVPENEHFSVTEVNRVGVRIYLDVGSGGPPPTKFAITSVTGGRSPGGSPEVIADVRDTGARAIDLSGSLRLFDGPGGSSAGPFQFQSGITLAPGQAGQMRAVLDKTTPEGSWHVTVTLASGNTAEQAHAVIQLGAMRPTGFVLPKRALVAGGALAAVLALAGWLFFAKRFTPRRLGRV